MSTGNSKKSTLSSMTAYAELRETFTNKKNYFFQLRSVNHRYFEFKWLAPKELQSFEYDAKNLLQKNFERGTFSLSVQEVGSAKNNGEKKSSQDFFKALLEGIQKAKTPGLSLEQKATLLASYPEFWLYKKSDEVPSQQDFKKALGVLIKKLSSQRKKEGEEIKKEFRSLFEQITKSFELIHSQTKELRTKWEADYKQRLEELAQELKINPPAKERIFQEFLILAENRDVAEELSRIKMHLKAAREVIEVPSAESKGKRLDFYSQELLREWTTLGNKIKNPDLTKIVIDAKLVIEKIREQCLNIV